MWITLTAAFLLGGVLLAPLVWFSTRRERVSFMNVSGRGGGINRFIFFACLGSAFMIYEIILLEQCTLFLSYPFLSLALVLSAILIFSALGSITTERYFHRGDTRRLGGASCFLLAVSGGGYAAGLSLAFHPFLTSPLWVRILIVLFLLARPCFLMGVPFPLGMSWVREHYVKEVPVCWGSNGWASVVFAVMTPLIAIHLGLPGALCTGAGFYLLAGFLYMQMVKK